MPDINGSGRLDRIEALLDKMAEQHELDFRHLMTWQVLMQEKMDRYDAVREKDRQDAMLERQRLDALSEKTDQRIADLVSAIGKLISAQTL